MFFIQFSIHLPYKPTILLLGIHPRKVKPSVHKKTRTKNIYKIISWLAYAAYFAGCPREAFKVNPVSMQRKTEKKKKKKKQNIIGLGG